MLGSVRARSWSLVVILAIPFVGCKKAPTAQEIIDDLRTHSTPNIGAFIFDAVQSNRVVMLGDAGHGVWDYRESVLRFLNYWVDTLALDHAPDSNLPHRLFLVLEDNTSGLSALQQYFKSGNAADLMYQGFPWAGQFTTSELEFSAELGRVIRRIDSLNNVFDSSGQIAFQLVAPESTLLSLDSWSFAKRDSFFVYRRDIYSSNQISSLLDSHPNWHALIFYGQAHFATDLSWKQADSVRDSAYYMAHYLSEHFATRGGFTKIGQIATGPMLDIGYPYVTHLSRLIPSQMKNRLLSQRYDDALIVRRTGYANNQSVSSVKSQNLVNVLLQDVDELCDTTNDFHKTTLSIAPWYLTYVTGSEIDTANAGSNTGRILAIKKWQRWFGEHHIDVVSDMQTFAPVYRHLEYMSRASGRLARGYEDMICKALQYDLPVDTTSPPSTRAAMYQELIQTNGKFYAAQSLIGLMWVGTDEERKNAVITLEEITGQRFPSPHQWTNWWREHKSELWGNPLDALSSDSLPPDN